MAIDEGELRRWAEDAMGGPVASWTLLTAGNSRRTWAVDVDRGAGAVLALVVRQDAGGGPVAGTDLTLGREARAYAALAGRGLAIPRFHAVHPTGEAVILERIAGTTDEPATALDDLLERVADLHRVPLDELDLPGAGDSSIADVERWVRILRDKAGDADELGTLAGRVLLELHPGEPERRVFCHGDVGVGNFLRRSDRVTGLLDWEFWHAGDPHDDLAWIPVRATLFGMPLDDTFGERVRRRYAPRAGVRLDEERLRYWQAVCLYRNLVCCLAVIHDPDPHVDRLLHLMLAQVVRRQLVAAMCRLVGVEIAPAPPLGEPRPLPGAPELQAIAAGLDVLVEGVADVDLRLRARRMRRLAAQLAQTWSLAFAAAQANDAEAASDQGDDLAATLLRLGRAADRDLVLFPGSRRLAELPVAGFETG